MNSLVVGLKACPQYLHSNVLISCSALDKKNAETKVEIIHIVVRIIVGVAAIISLSARIETKTRIKRLMASSIAGFKSLFFIKSPYIFSSNNPWLLQK